MKSREENPVGRLNFFLRALWRHALPAPIRRWRTQKILTGNPPGRLPETILHRLDYYNKLSAGAIAAPNARPIGAMTYMQDSFYVIDFLEIAKGFGAELAVETLFGDITQVPEYPSLVKSRPIRGDNANSVLFPFDKFRHFKFPKDPISRDAKRPFAVWRGRDNNSQRLAAVRRFIDHQDHDIAMVEYKTAPQLNKDWLSFGEQFSYRYMLSIEGNDVATNLKRIMASNSVAVSPPMQYETWFREGMLIPDVHFISVRSDFADLDEKIRHYEANPDNLATIIQNANDWTDQFRDTKTEIYLATLVLQKYFEMTGVLPNTDWPTRHFT